MTLFSAWFTAVVAEISRRRCYAESADWERKTLKWVATMRILQIKSVLWSQVENIEESVDELDVSEDEWISERTE